MIYYFLISAFTLGLLVGLVLDGKKALHPFEWMVVVLLGIFWPFTAFIYAKDWLEGRK